jgi:hypothetical protein
MAMKTVRATDSFGSLILRKHLRKLYVSLSAKEDHEVV